MSDPSQETPKAAPPSQRGASIPASMPIRVYEDTNHLIIAEALAGHIQEFYAQGGRVIFLEDKQENQDGIDRYMSGKSQSFRMPRQETPPFGLPQGSSGIPVMNQAQVMAMGGERLATSLSEAGLKCLLDECKKYPDLKVVCVDVPLKNQKAIDYINEKGYDGTLNQARQSPKSEKERKKLEEGREALKKERGEANAKIVENIAKYLSDNYKNKPLPVSLFLIGAGHADREYLGGAEPVHDLLAKRFPGQVASVELKTTPDPAVQGMRSGPSGKYELYLRDPFAEKVRGNLEFLGNALKEAEGLLGFETAKVQAAVAKIREIKGALSDEARLSDGLKQLEISFSKESAPKDGKKAYEAIRRILEVSQSYVQAHYDPNSPILSISGREEAEKSVKDAQKNLTKEENNLRQKQPKQSSSLTQEIDLSAFGITGEEAAHAVKQHGLPLNLKAAAAIRGAD